MTNIEEVTTALSKSLLLAGFDPKRYGDELVAACSALLEFTRTPLGVGYSTEDVGDALSTLLESSIYDDLRPRVLSALDYDS